MKLYAIRHGEYVNKFDAQGRKLVHTSDSSLDALGELQTYQLAEEIKRRGVKLDALYTSPYRRARETTDILANELAIKHVVKIDGLKDVFPNSADGKLWDELEAIGGDIYANPLEGEPQETLDHMVERTRLTMQSILAEAKAINYTSIGLVSHGDILSALDWTIKHSDNPASYVEMRDVFYLQKAEVCEYTLNEQFRLSGEGRTITIEAVKQSIEGFRNSRHSEGGS